MPQGKDCLMDWLAAVIPRDTNRRLESVLILSADAAVSSTPAGLGTWSVADTSLHCVPDSGRANRPFSSAGLHRHRKARRASRRLPAVPREAARWLVRGVRQPVGVFGSYVPLCVCTGRGHSLFTEPRTRSSLLRQRRAWTTHRISPCEISQPASRALLKPSA